MVEFIDIEIIDVDKKKTHKVTPEEEMYYVYLKLSKNPTSQWSEIFLEERKFPRHTMWRDAWIEGKYIVIECALDEVKKYHLRDLKVDVGNVNKKCREFLKAKEIERKKNEEEVIKEKKKIDEELDDLDFE